MVDFNILTETYFGMFLVAICLIYAITMVVLMFIVREYSFKQAHDDLWKRADNNSRIPTRNVFYKRWLTDYYVIRDPNYVVVWGIASRTFSTIHAIIMTVTSCYLIATYGFWQLWDYDFYFTHPDGMSIVINLNSLMAAYLIVDLGFLVGHQIQHRTDDNFYFAVVHHLVGAYSMMGFVNVKQNHFNSLYYSLTEISTITLNITWLAMKLGWDKDSDLKIIYQLAGIATWLLFLSVRIIGSVVLIINLSQINHIHYWIQMSLTDIVLILVANPIVIALNYIWFYKLTIKMLDAVLPPILISPHIKQE